MSVPVLEIGGSHVTAAMVSPAAGVVEDLHRAGLDSKAGADSIIDELCDAARQLPLAKGLAVALPGPFDFAAGIAWYQLDKFASLYGHDLGQSLRERLSLDHVVFLNDAEAFTVGEWSAGELRGLDRCAGITIGTGIGSAFLANGRAIRTGNTVPPGGELYRTTHNDRPLEDWISARAILTRYAESLASQPGAPAEQLPSRLRGATEELASPPSRSTAGSTQPGGAADALASPPSRSTANPSHSTPPLPPGFGVKEVAELARAGDPNAKDALVGAFQVLSDALVPWLERFGATRVVLGGSISGAFDVVADVFPFPVSATADTEHSALIGAAAHYERSTGSEN